MENIFWQSYKQGLGVGLGLLTIYLAALILIGVFVVRPALENLGNPGQSALKGGGACSTSWV